MPIFQAGTINTTALIVPDLYVQIVPPQNLFLNGVPTNVLAVVGTATWGPLNVPTVVGSMAQYQQTFGALQARAFDAGTQVATAVQQGASNFRIVRVSDGTDAKATVLVQTSCITFNSIYSGTQGNLTTVTLAAGSKAGTTKAMISLPGMVSEVFDNVAGAANAFWVNLATAINGGNSALRGPSLIVTAVAGAGVAAPTLATLSLLGGVDGVATITGATLVGLDVGARTGMYALRNQGVSIAVLADLTDSTQWSTAAAFGLSEGIYMVLAGPAGDNVANAITTKNTAGLDSYSAKLLFGDYALWNDPVNGVMRLVSPQGFVAGRLANLSPEQSSLNKPIYGIANTQRAGFVTSGTYSSAELQLLIGAGIDVITNPVPGGYYYGCRAGHNSSSSAPINGDNYTRMTNFIASSLNAGMGTYVGQLINTSLASRVKATLVSFLANMLGQGMLGTLDGSLPYSVICDSSNNPFTRTALGYFQADCQVQFQAINEKFIVNIEGGQTVSITRQTLPAGRVGVQG